MAVSGTVEIEEEKISKFGETWNQARQSAHPYPYGVLSLPGVSE